MGRTQALEALLEQLSAARADPTAAGSLALLREALRGRSSHAAAKAAEIVGEFEIDSLTPDLAAAFERFLDQPVKSDPGCAGKAAIADALYRIGAMESEVYLKGVRHVQMEPVWGGRADTATQLRGTCALALVRIHHPDFLVEIGDLLADRESPVRRMAAQALAYSESPGAVPLLRLKALIGDDDPQVVGECLLALLRIAPRPSVEFVASFLDHSQDEIAEAAALALGASRATEAFPVLKEWWGRKFDPALRRTALLALAMLKCDEAIDFLLSHAEEAPPIHARDALHALSLYRHDGKLRAQVEAVLTRRGDESLREFFVQAFDESSDPV
jgi:HEAT repeat protein